MANSALRERLEAQIKENQSKGLGFGTGIGSSNHSSDKKDEKEDTPVFKSTDFLIKNNVMVWKDMILPLSNMSAVSAWHRAETKSRMEKSRENASFSNFLNDKPFFYIVLVALIICFFVGISGNALLFLAAIGLVVWLFRAYGSYVNVKKQPQLVTDTIHHYYVRIIMNSGNRYDFEVRSKAFRDKMISIIYDIMSDENGKYKNVYYNSVTNMAENGGTINGSQIITGDIKDSQVVNSSGGESHNTMNSPTTNVTTGERSNVVVGGSGNTMNSGDIGGSANIGNNISSSNQSVWDLKKAKIDQLNEETLGKILQEIRQNEKNLSRSEQMGYYTAQGAFLGYDLDRVRKYLWEQVKSLPGGIIAGIITKYL